MRINFNNIKIDNFLSIGHCELDLKNSGFILVNGINHNVDDFAKSNGSGKSSLFESIIWCLTGETIRGIKSGICNNYTDDGACVELNVDIDNNNWILIRSKDHSIHKTNFKIWQNGNDLSGKGIRDTENIFKTYFPDLTSMLIGSVMILGQGLPYRFSDNTPSGRKEALEKLSKSDFMIEDLKFRIKNRADQLNKDLRKFEDLKLSNVSKLTILKDTLVDTEKSLKNLSNIEEILASIKDLNRVLEEKTKDLTDLENSIELTNEELNNNRQKLNELNHDYTKQLELILEQESAETSIIQSSNSDNINTLTSRRNKIKLKIDLLIEEINEKKSIVDICPTCKQKIIGVVKPDTTGLESQCDRLTKDLSICDKNLDKLSIDTKNRLNILKIKYDNLKKDIKTNFNNNHNSILTVIDNLKKQLSINKDAFNNLKSSIDLIKKQLSDNEMLVTMYYSNKNTLEQSISKLNKDINDLEEEILYISNNIENINNRIALVNKFSVSIARDFRGILLESVIKFISNIAKSYSQYIFNTDKIIFELNGNSIYIGYNGKAYESLSGGERQKVDLIVQFAIRDMLSKYLNFSCNILVLDEIFDNLDSIGCQKILDLITHLNDISSIYIITHHLDLNLPYDKEIIVEKNNQGVSNVNVVLH